MSSQNTEKKPPISHVKLFVLYVISGMVMFFILDIFLDDFILIMAITLITLLPIYSYFSLKYYHKPFAKWVPLKKREGNQCPHHPNRRVVINCTVCNIPICERCQSFKTEMRNMYQHNFRINHKFFEQSICVDCLFRKLEVINKILLIAGPVGFVLGIIFIVLGYYVEFLPFNLFLIGGIVISILCICLFIFGILIQNERERLIAQFPLDASIEEK